jgi:hypothetical protein
MKSKNKVDESVPKASFEDFSRPTASVRDTSKFPTKPISS